MVKSPPVGRFVHRVQYRGKQRRPEALGKRPKRLTLSEWPGYRADATVDRRAPVSDFSSQPAWAGPGAVHGRLVVWSSHWPARRRLSDRGVQLARRLLRER